MFFRALVPRTKYFERSFLSFNKQNIVLAKLSDRKKSKNDVIVLNLLQFLFKTSCASILKLITNSLLLIATKLFFILRFSNI